MHAAEVRPTQVIFSQRAEAEVHAKDVSRDTGVLAGAVTRYVLDQLGQRTAVALYVGGKKQEVPYVSDNRKIWANDLMK